MTVKSSKKRILFFLNHPAHYHLFKNVINSLSGKYDIKVAIVKKDILEDLVKKEGWDYVNIFPEGRRNKKLPKLFAMMFYLFKTEIRLYLFARKFNPCLMVGTEGTIAHISFLLGKKSILFNEDDTKATPENYLFYPFATRIIMPQCCDVGKWDKKKIAYTGYQKLAYLHPAYFTPDKEKIKNFNPDGERYFIIRLAELSASHDIGKGGINDNLAEELIATLEKYGKVFITAERPLIEKFEKYRIKINPHDIFHAMYFADIYIGDSQSMTMESSLLGTPAIRYNDFIGLISVLEELEHKYELTFGVKTGDKKKLFDILQELLNTPNLKRLWSNKRERMLIDQIDVCNFYINCIENILKDEKK